MDSQRRQYPRLPVETRAVVEVKSHPSEAALFPATVFSLSCDGAGLSLRGLITGALPSGREVQLRFPVAGEEIQLPAKVAWYTAVGGTKLGVEFKLAQASAECREAYARWISGAMRDRGLA
jgi:hypothetical protein